LLIAKTLRSFAARNNNNYYYYNNNNNNNNYNNCGNVYGDVIVTDVIARVHPVHFMNAD